MRRSTAATETATGADRRLGRYRLLDLVEREGDARLHRAVDMSGRMVALWAVPLARLCTDAGALERFRHMAAAAARLSHPVIPTILASGEHGGIAFVATMPADGPALGARLADGPLGREEALATLDRVLDALAAAHHVGVVHGALNADTIRHSGAMTMVTGFGRAAPAAIQAGRRDDLSAAMRLTERLLTAHAGHPGVAALLTELRNGGAGAFPDALSLQRAVASVNEAPVPPPPAGPALSRRRPPWLGVMLLAGSALMGGLAVVAVSDRPLPSPAPLPVPSPGKTAEAATVATADPVLPSTVPTTTAKRPPVDAVAQALRSIPCALVGVEAVGGRLLASGTVAGEQAETEVRETVEALAAGWDHGFDLATADAQFCAPLGSVAAALDANRELADPLTATVPAGPALNAGEPLILEIRAPAHPVQLQVDYFTIDGTVVHLLPNPSDSHAALPAGASRRLGKDPGGETGKSERSWTIGPPFGTEMLLTIATAAALFPTPRPEQESAADYLLALADALATIPADAPVPLADARFIVTGP
ncbi:serine/threonine protein kinase [Azospirillum sp. YIM B02556]|uniref:Serine/threonine protein kinase n=1 Tax=Azospirillum endophyticum TaxID=2800326 RepID=A0ABS1F106_9PROT|nr:DUF4384 domain-containing protein [Azospirillum endophyticum]MBK1837095.1 serine/threonine protein kinase [Azospirillum endophyticum]